MKTSNYSYFGCVGLVDLGGTGFFQTLSERVTWHDMDDAFDFSFLMFSESI